MSRNKALALTGLLLILGSGLAPAQEKEQNAVAERARNNVRFKPQDRTQNRMRFQDQNGDGINDFQRDYDADGIPNCQDPDWTAPKDGTGNKSRFGQGGTHSFSGSRHGFLSGHSWSKSTFRGTQKGPGGGVCDGTGPKGTRRGKGRN
jgi:hypothetical protein